MTNTAAYAPALWTNDQWTFHQSSTLEGAFTQASCLSGGWYHAPVIIYSTVTPGGTEHYWILPEEAAQPKGYERCFRVERLS